MLCEIYDVDLSTEMLEPPESDTQVNSGTEVWILKKYGALRNSETPDPEGGYERRLPRVTRWTLRILRKLRGV
jgi:hypothetical protein